MHSSTGLKIALVIGAAAIQLILPLLGHRAMLRILRLLVGPFVVLFVIFAILALPKAHLGAGHDASWQDMLAALALVLSSGGYGWPMNANDFSRYLPPAASPRRRVAASDRRLGRARRSDPDDAAAAPRRSGATAVPASSDAIGGLPHALAGWFVWPYLVFVIAQLFGMAAAASWLNAYPAPMSPLTEHTGGADFSVFMGALFGGGVYWLLARRSVRVEADAAPSPAEADADMAAADTAAAGGGNGGHGRRPERLRRRPVAGPRRPAGVSPKRVKVPTHRATGDPWGCVPH